MSKRCITIQLATQALDLSEDEHVLRTYLVSTAKNGAGEQVNSCCTPRGHHIIRAKIGAGCPLGTVFVGRRPTGEIWTPALSRKHPGRDWILSRILWLRGCEPGKNRGGSVDTMQRYIYIHGAPEDVPMGSPTSQGCIRMRNDEISELFDLIAVGTPVRIHE
jgi:L,D-transpeptidase YbiS